jgi:hypothetical protein
VVNGEQTHGHRREGADRDRYGEGNSMVAHPAIIDAGRSVRHVLG